MTSVPMGERFPRALAFANDLHAEQTRKGSEVPYVGHLLGTAALVIDDGGSEDEAIAALLHDAAEDQGGEAMLARIEYEFGTNVRRIVEACSDTFQIPRPPWRERKERYIASIPMKSPDELRVSLADKVYNARAILHDLNAVGERLWGRFSADRGEVLWYYRSLADAFARSLPGPLADELAFTVDALEHRVG